MTTRTALWREIAETLTGEIAAGHYPPGAKLPSEAALAARFGVNRHTVRRALGDLAGAGLVHARRGAGVFAATRPTEYPIGRRVRFHQSLRAAGRIPGKEILALETRAADAAEAEALGLAAGAAVHVADGISLADGVPLALFRSVFPAARLPGMPAALRESHSVTEAFRRHGIADYTRASTRLGAERASAVQAARLRLPEGAPLLKSVGVNVDPEGRPLEYGTTWFAGERVTLTLSDG